MRTLWLLVCLGLLAACSSPPTAASIPTQQTLIVRYPTSLHPWSMRLQSCAVSHPEVALIQEEISPVETALPGTQVLVWLESSPLSDGTSWNGFVIGIEKWTILVNEKNPVRLLSPPELRDIFTGLISSWDELPGEIGGLKQEIEVWSLSPGDPIAIPYLNLVLEAGRLATQAQIAPDPAAMLEAVAKNPAAIGFVPTSWLVEDRANPTSIPASIHAIQVESPEFNAFSQKVLALLDHEPAGELRAILVCAQSIP